MTEIINKHDEWFFHVNVKKKINLDTLKTNKVMYVHIFIKFQSVVISFNDFD